MAGLRMAVIWCPDWPLVCWGVPMDEPAMVLVANRVVATTPAAREFGVRLGHSRREAQARCPEAAILSRDVDREVRLFDPVVASLDELTPRVEVAGPGLVGFPTRGPSRFFGGDHALADRVYQQVQPILDRRFVVRGGEVRVALADGVFAARLAARATSTVDNSPVRVIEPGDSPAFLASLPITTLEMPDLTDVLVRLGLTTLGHFAALSVTDVVGRFGREGCLAHRLAQGEDDHPPDLRRPATDLAVSWAFEPPAERVETCAYVAKVLADEFHERLASKGLACTRVAIEAETETGAVSVRLWRDQGALNAAAVADRARWQLDAWLNQAAQSRPDSGIVRLTLVPDEVVPATGRQLGFWGASSDRAEDVTRVVARLQALLGPDAVLVPEFRGGIGPGERLAMVPAAAVDLTAERPAAKPGWVSEPWPGQLPAPSPARVHPDPVPVSLLGDGGVPVTVSARGEMSHIPVSLQADARTPRRVNAWAGPWPAEQRWWDPLTSSRRARIQLSCDDGTAHLLILDRQQWYVEATYD